MGTKHLKHQLGVGLQIKTIISAPGSQNVHVPMQNAVVKSLRLVQHCSKFQVQISSETQDNATLSPSKIKNHFQYTYNATQWIFLFWKGGMGHRKKEQDQRKTTTQMFKQMLKFPILYPLEM